MYEIFYSQSSTYSGSSTSFSFRNVTPDDTKPYIMRVVVKPSTAESMRSTIKRQIWIPGMQLIVQALCACMQVWINHVKCGHQCSRDKFSHTKHAAIQACNIDDIHIPIWVSIVTVAKNIRLTYTSLTSLKITRAFFF